MNQVRVITADDVGFDHDLPIGWGDEAESGRVTGTVRYVELRKDGLEQLGITILADGSLELETFGHGYSLRLVGQVVLQKG